MYCNSKVMKQARGSIVDSPLCILQTVMTLLLRVMAMFVMGSIVDRLDVSAQTTDRTRL